MEVEGAKLIPDEDQTITVPERKPSSEPTVKPKTEAVNVSNLTQENKDTIQVDWGASEQGKENSFFSGPTKKVPEVPKSEFSTSSQNVVSGPSFEIGVKVLIAIIDFIMSNVLWKISGDGKASSYAADVESKKNLQDSLIMILGEQKIKMPTWLICLFAFLAAYGFQIMAAIDARKNKQQNKTAKVNDKASLEPGLFTQNGKQWRRYANGSVREAKFDVAGNEVIVGQPPKFSSRRRAA